MLQQWDSRKNELEMNRLVESMQKIRYIYHACDAEFVPSRSTHKSNTIWMVWDGTLERLRQARQSCHCWDDESSVVVTVMWLTSPSIRLAMTSMLTAMLSFPTKLHTVQLIGNVYKECASECIVSLQNRFECTCFAINRATSKENCQHYKGSDESSNAHNSVQLISVVSMGFSPFYFVYSNKWLSQRTSQTN